MNCMSVSALRIYKQYTREIESQWLLFLKKKFKSFKKQGNAPFYMQQCYHEILGQENFLKQPICATTFLQFVLLKPIKFSSKIY